ncbi:hypothetical protein B0H19DRAFT_1181491 [Mycena capillaripes]|nr:hypothetical protein B0H19DRAFT_1181491 [Mycena capillaripes]
MRSSILTMHPRRISGTPLSPLGIAATSVSTLGQNMFIRRRPGRQATHGSSARMLSLCQGLNAV